MLTLVALCCSYDVFYIDAQWEVFGWWALLWRGYLQKILNGCVFGLYYELLLFGLCVQQCIGLLFIEVDGMIATVGPPFSMQN